MLNVLIGSGDVAVITSKSLEWNFLSLELSLHLATL